MRSPLGAFIFIAVMLLLDFYVFQGVKAVMYNASARTKTWVSILYWTLSVCVVTGFLLFVFTPQELLGRKMRTYVFSTIMGLFIAKVVMLVFFVIDDLRRIIQWIVGKVFSSNTEVEGMIDNGISRSTFLSWLGLAAGGGIFSTLLYGYSNKYNYNVKKVLLQFSKLPKAFHGLRVVQISDVHSGSFTNKKAVQKGIDKIMSLKPDIIFFTGDLVNDLAEEMAEYEDVFSQLKAPMGVFSTLGNHDYADYVRWADRDDAHRAEEERVGRHLLTPLQNANLDKLKAVHSRMGWRLLLDEYVVLQKNGEEIALLGVQNISGKKGRFHSYGSLSKAYAGSEKYTFKILLSHDPSHWEYEVTKDFKDVDLMLSGHTHGMQFGVEIPGFKWSPVQYVYKQWGGLYENDNQKLYVNRGFGFIGYPGRVGILPEITLMELTSA